MNAKYCLAAGNYALGSAYNVTYTHRHRHMTSPMSYILYISHLWLQGEEEEEQEGAPRAPGVAPLQSRPAEGMRPASVASLLKTSPQAVPFSRRVDLFRLDCSVCYCA